MAEPGIIHLFANFATGIRNFGLYNVLEGIFLTRLSWFWKTMQAIPPLRSVWNRKLINHAIYKIPTRPNPLSTQSDYTSWSSLTDRTFSARHLPPYVSKDPLPPASEVAELFRRPENSIKQGKSTVLFTYFAQWFTDGFLRTDYFNPLKNTSNHDIDLSNLYGLTPEDTNALREHQGGRLKSQILNDEEYPPFFYQDDLSPRPEFANLKMAPLIAALQAFGKGQVPATLQNRLKLFAGFQEVLERPGLDTKMLAMGGDRTNSNAGFTAMNTLFLREHNRICAVLAKANGTWDDERLFQTARNILIAILCRIVIEEYINHITPYQFQFQFRPGQFETQRWYRMNWMAVEFNLLYRWHGLTPNAYVLTNHPQPLRLIDNLFHNDLAIERGLGPFLQDASRQQAGRVGAFNTPDVLVPVEEGSVQLGRDCRLAPYNDYRELCGMPRVSHFEQISTDPAIQSKLKDLYGRVDRVEYYPGIFSEDIIGSTVVPYLIGRLVSVDAFSQALTNPLFSARVLQRAGLHARRAWKSSNETGSLQDLMNRNVPPGKGPFALSMNFTPAKAPSALIESLRPGTGRPVLRRRKRVGTVRPQDFGRSDMSMPEPIGTNPTAEAGPQVPFELGLVMAGAISAGAYTAGVVDFLIEALDAWEAAKAHARAHPEDPASREVPNHEVRLKVLSGASAGGITAALTAGQLGMKFDPVRSLPPTVHPPPPGTTTSTRAGSTASTSSPCLA